MDALTLGLAAAALQVAGYAFYGSKVLSRDIRPNATSWIMFAYGTALLVIVEWDRDASFALLALPAACALSSVFVAFYALRRAKGWWPPHRLEQLSFTLDALLTLFYLATWILLAKQIIGEGEKDIAEIFILICWNIGVFTSYFPLLRQVYHHPHTEHPTPWVVWMTAYGLLIYLTAMEAGFTSELMVYPILNLAVSAFVAAHTAYWHSAHKRSVT